MPNLMLSIHPDYVNYYLLTPVARRSHDRRVGVDVPSGNDGDPAFNPADAIGFWDVTNRQDWDIVERSQLGHLVAALRAGSVLAAREHARGVGS